MLRKYPILYKKTLLLTAVASCTLFFAHTLYAGVINMPLKRSNANQPITKLEVVALVKSKLKGRILSVKTHRSYANPDCFYVKLLEDSGEYQLIKVGCTKKK